VKIQKRLLIFGGVLFLFAAVDFWIYRNLAATFLNYSRDQRREIAGMTLSGGAGAFEASLPGGVRLARIQGLPGIDEDHVYSGSDAAFLAYVKENENTPLFAKAFESASYEEIYQTSQPLSWQEGVSEYLLFAPLYGEEGWVEGVALFAFPREGERSFLDLLNTFALGAFLLFAAIFGIVLWSRDPVTGFAILGLFAMVGVFVAYPLFQALRLTFLHDGTYSLEIWRSIFSSRQYGEAFRGSLLLGGCTATASTLVGFLFAFVLTRTRVPCRRFFGAMGTLPIISPPFSLTLSVILLFGNNGLITKQLLGLSGFSIYGLGGLVLVQTMGMFPIAFLTLSGVLQAIDSTFEDAALDLSASRWTTFRTITFPLALPGILSAWLLVFTNSLADFANPLILSGSYRVLSVEAYMEVTGMNRLGNGAALSILLLLPTLTAFFVQRFWVSRKSVVTVTGKPSARVTELVTPGVKRILVGSMILVVAFLFVLYGTIVAGCFVKNWGIDYSFSLENIVEAFTRGKDALLDTLTLAGAATPVAGILSMVAALLLVRKRFPAKRFLEALIMTPFALPGTLVGISYILAFNQAPLLLVGTGLIIIINYVVRELPVGVEGGVASLRQIDGAIEEAAQDLGADTPTVFRTIVLPLIRPAFISSLSYTFVRSMTAVSAVIFLISAKWYHLTVLIYNFSENLRFGLASVLATTLILIVFTAFGIMRLLLRQNKYLEKTISF
jgi:iron(III) transport system permease protein